MNNIRKIKLIFIILSLWLFTSCGVQWHLSTVNHDPIYGTVYVDDDVKVDTLNYSQFKRKLRTDFSFRWDYANYMMNQPLSFYYRNYPGYLGNVHDFWWNSNQYWTDWAFNYPFTSFNSWYWDRWDPWPRWRHNRWWGYGGGWYANTWNNHWYNYGYSGWYGHNSMIWGNTWRNDNTYVHINGRRGSSNISVNGSSRGNSIIRNNDNGNRVIRRYDNPTRGRNNNVIIRNNNNNNNNIRVNPPRGNNNIRVNPPSNNNIRVNPPRGNNNIRSSSPPVINRGSNNISRGSSNSNSNSRSSRGSRGNN